MPKVTKTLGPIHFEDLEPHRFEDLVRELIYDFKDWFSIEATGRGGSDDGFDVRAWEKTQEVTNKDEEGEEGTHIEGDLWQIQCKREKELGPANIKKVIENGVDKDNPPYGYILVAPVNFSKKSYDTFREELRKKGVTEFHLWGRAALEDMLHMPKNDHILFTFFGVSLVVRKRARATEVKFAINNKNKLLRVLSDGKQTDSMNASVLIRDIKDTNYPYKGGYKDFDKKPRWEEHIAFGYHAKGLLIHARERYAYVDTVKKEWDITKEVDLIMREKETETRDEEDYKNRSKVEDFWKHLPRRNQGKIAIDGLIRFEDMLVIDDKGDILYDFPHIFIDWQFPYGPFSGTLYTLTIDGNRIDFQEKEYKKIDFFPKKFPEIKKVKLHKDKAIEWDIETLRLFNINSEVIDTLFDIDGKYSFLEPRDAILVAGGLAFGSSQEKVFIKVTHKYITTVKEYIEYWQQPELIKQNIERQVGRNVQDNESITVYEFDRTYEWAVK